MKIPSIIILIFFGLSISVNNPKALMLVAFCNYQAASSTINKQSSGIIDFNVYFIREKSTPRFLNMTMPITIQLENNTELKYEIECINNNYVVETGLPDLEDLYTCIDLYSDTLPAIKSVTPIINFTFYDNDTKSYINYNEKDINKSTLVDATIKNLTDLHNMIVFDIFYLEKIQLKNNEFILKGNLTGNVTEAYINLTFSGRTYNASVTKNEIRFNATDNIDDNLHGIMQESNAGGKYILIYAEKGIDDHLIYPVQTQNQKMEILGFGSYINSTANTNAKNQLFIEGNQYMLNNLKKYVRFNTILFYDKLRNLEESSITVEANGTLEELNQEKNFAIYNITYYETTNKNIINMTPSSNFEFSENGTNYEKIEYEIEIPPDVNLLEEASIVPERMTFVGKEPEKNSTSFSLLFNVSERLNLQNQNEAYLKYYPNNNNTLIDFIKCSCEENSTLYKIICFPKKNVFYKN